MPDRISNYRQVRMILQVPASPASRAHWMVQAMIVTKGVPHARTIEDGYLPAGTDLTTPESLMWALHQALGPKIL